MQNPEKKEKPFYPFNPDKIRDKNEPSFEVLFNSFFSPVITSIPDVLFEEQPSFDAIKEEYEKSVTLMDAFFKQKNGIDVATFCTDYISEDMTEEEKQKLIASVFVDAWYCHLINILATGPSISDKKEHVENFEDNLDFFVQELNQDLNLMNHDDVKINVLTIFGEKKQVVDSIMREAGRQRTERPNTEDTEKLIPVSWTQEINVFDDNKQSSTSKEKVVVKPALDFLSWFKAVLLEAYLVIDDDDHSSFYANAKTLIRVFSNENSEEFLEKRAAIENYVVQKILHDRGVDVTPLFSEEFAIFNKPIKEYLFFIGLLLAIESKRVAINKLGSRFPEVFEDELHTFRAGYINTEVAIDEIATLISDSSHPLLTNLKNKLL